MNDAHATGQPPAPHCHHQSLVSCTRCRLNTLCLPISLHVDDVEKLDEIIHRGRPLQKGQYLYQVGDAFTAIYAVRSGTIKTTCATSNGEEQVTGFYLPGEVRGLDGIADYRHTNTAVALDTAAVCEIPFTQLESLSEKLPSLQRHFLQLMGKEITIEHHIITLLSKNTAEERIATVLLSLSHRHHRRHLSATSFNLPMSRADLGNYLGLTIETVSRVLGRLQNRFNSGAVFGRDHQHFEGLIGNQSVAGTMQFAVPVILAVFLNRQRLQNIHQIAAAACGIHMLDGLQKHRVHG